MKLFLKIFPMVLFVSEIKFDFFLLCDGKNSREHKRELPYNCSYNFGRVYASRRNGRKCRNHIGQFLPFPRFLQDL